MQWSTDTFHDRLQQVLDRNAAVSIVDHDPIVLGVDDPASNQRHVVVPEAVTCSCPADGIDGWLCDHIIAAAAANGEAGLFTCEYLKERKIDLKQSCAESTADTAPARAKQEEILAVLTELDVTIGGARTLFEAIQVLAIEGSDSHGLDAFPDVTKPREDQAEFESMVKELATTADDMYETWEP